MRRCNAAVPRTDGGGPPYHKVCQRAAGGRGFCTVHDAAWRKGLTIGGPIEALIEALR